MPQNLFDPALYQVQLLTLQSLLVGLGILFLGIFALFRMRRSLVSVTFFLLALTVGEWLITYGMLYATDDMQVGLWWAKAGYVGIAFVPAVLSSYISSIVQDHEQFRVRLTVYWGISTIFLVLILMTDIHFAGLRRYSWGYYPRYGLTSMPFILYFFWVSLESSLRLMKAYRGLEKGTPQSLAARELLTGLLVGLIASVDYLIGFGINIPPFGYIFIFLFVLISTPSVLYNRMVAITPAFAARQIIATMSDALLVLDRTGIIRLVNQTACAMFGLSEEQLVGKAPGNAMAENTACAGVLAALINGEGVSNLEMDYRQRGENVPRCLGLSASIMRDPSGVPLSVVCVVRDITERKRAEEKLEQLALAIDQTSETIIITDTTGAIVYANPAFEQATGYRREEALGLNPRLLKSDKHDDAFYSEMWSTLQRGEPWSGQIINRRKDGSLFTEEAVISPVRDRTGTTVSYVAVKRDITENLRLEEQLRQAQKMESVGRLAGGVAHDFNNMLTVIIGHTQLAMLTLDESHPLFQRLTDIHQAADRAADLTRQLLAFARKQTITLQVLDLNKTVEGMLNMLRRLIGENITLSWIPGKDLASIKMDPSQIDQILVNLCVNAKDAITGTGKIIIETDSVSLDEAYCSRHTGFVPGDYVQLIVSDTGCGMDAHTLSHLFEPFYTTKESGKGTGLGMAMVYGIVKQNDGFINVYSEPDKGTSFSLYFPRCSGQADLQVDKVWHDAPLLGSETILLVEDGAMILDITRTMLETQGYTVLAAATPGEAINLAKEYGGVIDLLLTDVIMPEMNGRDLSRHILGYYPNIKSMYMSGYTADIIAHHGVLDEGVHFIHKPFSMKDLGAKLREVLDGGKIALGADRSES